MGTVAAIGEPTRVEGFGLVGVLVLPAGTPDAVRAGWRRLPEDVALVIVTPTAAEAALAEQATDGGDSRLVVVLPP
jgi:vacuolar-type H+-ATPase subunit F/Vma7